MIYPSIFRKALSAVLLTALTAASGAELVLAENGQTAYKVVAPKSPDEMTAGAVEDLETTLKEITGADFAASSGKTRSIFVGVLPGCDKEPLREDERRITSRNGDIYLYGEGERGSVNAIYDCLRDELGCRWYTFTGDKLIPKRDKLVLGELKRSRIPSIPMMIVWSLPKLKPLMPFTRSAALYGKGDPYAGLSGHAGQIVIPSGLIPFGGKAGNIHGPLKYFKDKAYFKTNPDFFAMDKNGRRVTHLQLCYSNPKLRDEYERNIEIILAGENYHGERKMMSLLHDDHGGKFCYCPGCEALEKQYDHPAGAFYDFLFDMCRRFEKKHPKLTFACSAYRVEQTLTPPPHLKELPRNMLFGYSPLGCDFSKPLTHPVNASWAKPMRDWAKISRKMRFSAYPTTYPRPVVSYPLVANIHRLVENFRFAYDNKARLTYCEFGSGPFNTFGFNDLRVYVISELCRDITRDEQEMISEFTDACYGPAAPAFRKYLAELEKLEAEYPKYLRWNPDILTVDYANAANLGRWERDFDAMESRVGGNNRHLLNLRRARYNLDQMVIARWPYMTKEEQAVFGGLENVIARAEKTIVADAEDLREYARHTTPEVFARGVRLAAAWLHTGLDQYICRARGGKDLPAQFAKHKTVYRILPNRNKLGLDRDPEAPFGLCNTGKYSTWNCWFFMRSFVHDRKPQWESAVPPMPIGKRRFKNVKFDGQYRYYPLGAMTILPDSQIDISAISPVSGFGVGHLHDPNRPNRLYDFFVGMAIDPERKWVKLGELVVVPLDKDAAPKEKPKRTVNDNVDAFI